MSSRLIGSCLCGAIKYAINSHVKSVVNCHCGMCKKITGAAFETIAIVDEGGLELTDGKESLVSYTLTENADKRFCGACGTPIFNVNKRFPGNCMVHVGSLDNPSLVAPAMNIYCNTMLPWVGDIASLLNYENEPRR